MPLNVEERANENEEPFLDAVLEALIRFQGSAGSTAIADALRDGAPAEQIVDLFDFERLRADLAEMGRWIVFAYLDGADSAYEETQSGSRFDPSQEDMQNYLLLLPAVIQLIADSTRNGIVRAVQRMFDQQVAPQTASRLIQRYAGLTQNQIPSIDNARLNMLLSRTPFTTVNQTVQRAVDTAIENRARDIARNELYQAFQFGRRGLWQQWLRAGSIPDTILKTWVTRDDEFVCPVCGPLHLVSVPINQLFPGGLTGSPAHNRCRCNTRLGA